MGNKNTLPTKIDESGGLSFPGEGAAPHCLMCNRQVDFYKVETPVSEIVWGGDYTRFKHSGEIIVTVECHGEKWRASNWRGRLD
jgi:hypothetical protein|tara:strand:- start:913 stop:1164 length:252 start_codon:yes stop_codon:yes gene_type:complete